MWDMWEMGICGMCICGYADKGIWGIFWDMCGYVGYGGWGDGWGMRDMGDGDMDGECGEMLGIEEMGMWRGGDGIHVVYGDMWEMLLCGDVEMGDTCICCSLGDGDMVDMGMWICCDVEMERW